MVEVNFLSNLNIKNQEIYNDLYTIRNQERSNLFPIEYIDGEFFIYMDDLIEWFNNNSFDPVLRQISIYHHNNRNDETEEFLSVMRSLEDKPGYTDIFNHLKRDKFIRNSFRVYRDPNGSNKHIDIYDFAREFVELNLRPNEDGLDSMSHVVKNPQISDNLFMPIFIFYILTNPDAQFTNVYKIYENR